MSIEDRKEFFHFVIGLENFTELHGIHSLGLLESLEYNILGGNGFVCDWAFKLIKIVSSHGGEFTSSADVLVKFVLKVDE